MELGLEGKVALVTGGSDGLGLATVRRLAAEGARVVACGRREDHLRAQLSGVAGETLAVRADVTDPADCARLVEAAVAAFGGLDILVNNAGASAAFRLEELSDEAWEADFRLKVVSAARLCRLAAPLLRARGGGSIVNASIGWGKAPAPGALPTSAMRAAGLNLTKSLAGELAGDNIRVNAICIGFLKSAQWERHRSGRAPKAIYDDFAARVPLGRVGEAEDYADLVAFLVSARATYITGTAINLDGGLCPVV